MSFTEGDASPPTYRSSDRRREQLADFLKASQLQGCEAASPLSTSVGDDSSGGGSESLLGGSPSPAKIHIVQVKLELEETSEKRREAELELQDLHAQLQALQGRVCAREQAWEELAKQEARLQRQVDDDVARQVAEAEMEALEESPELGFRQSPRGSDPDFFELEDAVDEAEESVRKLSTLFELECGPNISLCDSDDEDTGAMEDWESGLDALGIAKCRVCGLRLPLDAELIEKHSRECEKAAELSTESACRLCPAGDAAPLAPAGRCKRCGERIALDMDAIESHQNTCRDADEAGAGELVVAGGRGRGIGRLVAWGVAKR